MHTNKTLFGLTGILGIWLSAGIAFPLVNVLKELSPEQLMVARGGITSAIAFALLRGKIDKIEKWTFHFCFFFAIACVGFYNSIRTLGASLTIIIVSATPLVNFSIAYLIGNKVPKIAIVSLVIILTGITIALDPWTQSWNSKGLALAIFTTVTAGIGYEGLTRSQAPKLQQCFWLSTMMLVIGIIGSLHTSWLPIVKNPKMLWLVLGFGCTGGFIYFMAHLQAFKYLPIEVATVLVQGEAPAVIFGSGILLGEKLALTQWLGVAIALYGTWLLGHWMSKVKVHQPSKAS